MKHSCNKNTSLYVSIYREVKQKRKNKLKELYVHVDDFNPPLVRKHVRYNKPWYMMTKGKLYRYEERKQDWGTMCDYFKIDSETKKANIDIQVHALTRRKLLHNLIQQKEKKWIKKHPCPVDVHGNDLFKKEFLTEWNKNHAYALRDIHDFVRYAYYKTCVLGRFVTKTGYVEKKIGEIKINTREVENLRQPISDNVTKYDLDVRKILANSRKPNLVCAKLLDLNGEIRRVYVKAA